MFKKLQLFLFLSACMCILYSCSLNGTTGLVTIYNLTDIPIHNIKIGNTLIVFTLKSGEKYDYWFSSKLEGQVKGDEINEILVKFLINDNENKISYTIFKDSPTCNFKMNYEYHLDIVKVEGKNRMYVNPGMRAKDNTAYDYPAL